MTGDDDCMNIKDDRDEEIYRLRLQLQNCQSEIEQLKSQLDKFQTVFPLHFRSNLMIHQIGERNHYYHRSCVDSPKLRPRTQGISAEPQDFRSFERRLEKFDKNERLVIFW